MNREEFLSELLYREVGRELADKSCVVDLNYSMRAAAAMEEIYNVLREERVDSRTRVRRIQSVMLRHGVFCERPQSSASGVQLEEYLENPPQPPKKQKPVVIEKPRRGRPRKRP